MLVSPAEALDEQSPGKRGGLAAGRGVFRDPVPGDVEPGRDPDAIAAQGIVNEIMSASARPGRPTGGGAGDREHLRRDIALGI